MAAAAGGAARPAARLAARRASASCVPPRRGETQPVRATAGYVLHRAHSRSTKAVSGASGFNLGRRYILFPSGGGGKGGNSNGGGNGPGDSFGQWWHEEEPEDSAGRLLADLLGGLQLAAAAAAANAPLLTSGLATAVSLCCAEAITQLLILGNPGVDSHSLLRVLLFGLFLKGPLLNLFYTRLNSAFPSRQGWSLVKLLVADCGVGSMFFTGLYTFTLPLLRGARLHEAASACRDNSLEMWCIGLRFWPAAMALNYLFLPAALQLPYVLAVDVAYNTALSWKAWQMALGGAPQLLRPPPVTFAADDALLAPPVQHLASGLPVPA